VPAMTFKARSHAVDHHSAQCTLDLWRALCNLIQEQQQPLPAGCHLIPEVVATWNRGKSPNDVYSCCQKNCNSAHSHLGPVGAIWLRLIMACVHNAYHTHNLSQTASYLLSEECESFKDFHRMRERQLPFRQFCLELANDLKMEVVPPTMQNSGSDDDDRGHSTPSVAITYNKREAKAINLGQNVLQQPKTRAIFTSTYLNHF
jgi:hypothetical protein